MYAVPLLKPLTVIGEDAPVAVCPVLAVTVKDVALGESAGKEKATDTAASLNALATTSNSIGRPVILPATTAWSKAVTVKVVASNVTTASPPPRFSKLAFKESAIPSITTATAGATSAGNIATVASPDAAYHKPKRKDKYGAPKAPQKKKAGRSKSGPASDKSKAQAPKKSPPNKK